MAFKKATKHQAKGRVALIGPTGSGKSYSSLEIAKHMGGRIAVLDTERGSASKYADIFDFDVCELEDFAPSTYIRMIREASAYDILIIDSLSHAWMGEGGILSQVDKRGGKFDAWRHATPEHNRLVEAVLTFPGHVIATMRAKMAYEVKKQERNGRTETVVEKLGLAPMQREGLEYEFDVVGDMTQDNALHITKTRCPAFRGAVIDMPGEKFARTLMEWLNSGTAAPVERDAHPVAPAPTPAGLHAYLDEANTAGSKADLMALWKRSSADASLGEEERKTIADACGHRQRQLDGVAA